MGDSWVLPLKTSFGAPSRDRGALPTQRSRPDDGSLTDHSTNFAVSATKPSEVPG